MDIEIMMHSNCPRNQSRETIEKKESFQSGKNGKILNPILADWKILGTLVPCCIFSSDKKHCVSGTDIDKKNNFRDMKSKFLSNWMGIEHIHRFFCIEISKAMKVQIFRCGLKESIFNESKCHIYTLLMSMLISLLWNESFPLLLFWSPRWCFQSSYFPVIAFTKCKKILFSLSCF